MSGDESTPKQEQDPTTPAAATAPRANPDRDDSDHQDEARGIEKLEKVSGN